MKTFIAISGSLRKDSFNTRLLEAAKEIAEGVANIEIYDISSISLYNQDLEVNFPKEAQALKDKILASDGVIFATPEYNRSIPGVLKNAIDWASRPYGMNAFDAKPILILGVTPAPTGTTLGQSHLKQVMLYLNGQVLGQPEFYLGSVHEKFNAEGKLVDESTREHLKKAIEVLVNR